MWVLLALLIWIVFSCLAFKTFQLGYRQKYWQLLRLIVICLDVSILVLFLVPWLLPSLGSLTGWQLFRFGTAGTGYLFFLVLLAVIGLFFQTIRSVQIGAAAHLAASVVIFMVLRCLMPGAVVLDLGDIAPTIAAFELLVGNVVIILLLRQVDQKTKKPTHLYFAFLVAFIALGVFRVFPCPIGMSKEEAIETVAGQTEVLDFQQNLENQGKAIYLEAQQDEDGWLVQVFEIVGTGTDAHTATFDWYIVNQRTGQVTRQF